MRPNRTSTPAGGDPDRPPGSYPLVGGGGRSDLRDGAFGAGVPSIVASAGALLLVLPPMAQDLPRNRLGLAKWIVSGQHPLTARVVVNRIWQQYFGIGLVRTAEDLGIRGEPPTHAELLEKSEIYREIVASQVSLEEVA